MLLGLSMDESDACELCCPFDEVFFKKNTVEEGYEISVPSGECLVFCVYLPVLVSDVVLLVWFVVRLFQAQYLIHCQCVCTQ